jgi:transcription elongation factor Elf1
MKEILYSSDSGNGACPRAFTCPVCGYINLVAWNDQGYFTEKGYCDHCKPIPFTTEEEIHYRSDMKGWFSKWEVTYPSPPIERFKHGYLA